MKFVLYCCGSAGDVLPFVRIGSALRQRGHEVVLLAHATYRALAGRAGLTYCAYDTPEQYQALMADAALLNTPTGIPKFLNQHCLPRVSGLLRLIEQHAQGNTLLVTPPLFDTAPRLAAEKFGVPLRWAFLAPIQVAARELKQVLFQRMLGEAIGRLRESHGLAPIVDWAAWLDYTEPTLGLWPEWFAAAQPHWPALQAVGFPGGAPAEDIELPTEVDRFLIDHPRPVVITGGTGAFMGERYYATALAAAQQAGLASVVVTPYRELLPATLPTDCLWCERVAFARLFPRAGAVVHHGGIGTLAAAAQAGVPQLVLAFGADRPDNGQRVEELGIGKVEPPPQWQPALLAARLGQLLDESAGVRARCAQIANTMVVQDGAGAAAQWLEQVAV